MKINKVCLLILTGLEEVDAVDVAEGSWSQVGVEDLKSSCSQINDIKQELKQLVSEQVNYLSKYIENMFFFVGLKISMVDEEKKNCE